MLHVPLKRVCPSELLEAVRARPRCALKVDCRYMLPVAGIVELLAAQAISVLPPTVPAGLGMPWVRRVLEVDLFEVPRNAG